MFTRAVGALQKHQVGEFEVGNHAGSGVTP